MIEKRKGQTMKKLTRNGVLNELEKIGKDIKVLSDPNHYPLEKARYANAFKEKLIATRRAYAAIRDGADVMATLTWLRGILNNGMEGNHLSLIITAASTGFSDKHSWTVTSDAITFKD